MAVTACQVGVVSVVSCVAHPPALLDITQAAGEVDVQGLMDTTAFHDRKSGSSQVIPSSIFSFANAVAGTNILTTREATVEWTFRFPSKVVCNFGLFLWLTARL